ncbi:hypothetical protein E2C01_005767 [Portunus trituberculatus]|uniref:Uncharacterized protein n=1 Tax=Portunus trituberculatus TaxID=210409 RepID=A0A5B7CV59_PORTR|nr:hypothetical protein [Portunus trituberculatus]
MEFGMSIKSFLLAAGRMTVVTKQISTIAEATKCTSVQGYHGEERTAHQHTLTLLRPWMTRPGMAPTYVLR